jgi:hypothetical protein
MVLSSSDGKLTARGDEFMVDFCFVLISVCVVSVVSKSVVCSTRRQLNLQNEVLLFHSCVTLISWIFIAIVSFLSTTETTAE